MIERPLVTVVIPTYNHADFIQEALDSLCKQTYENWEAIVVNNFSEDDTVAVVESFADSRIRLENFRNNGVIAASRNHAISLAKGDFLAFLDSDDKWLPEKLVKCMTCFDDHVDLVCHGLHTFGNNPEYDFYGGPESKATFEALLYEGNCLTPTATVVRTAKVIEVGGFSESPEMVTSEDYHLWIKLAKAGVKMKFLKEVLGLYRIHAMGQSRVIHRHLHSVLAVLEDFLPSEENQTLMDKVRIRRRRCLAYYAAARDCQKSNQFEGSWMLLRQALRNWPFCYKTYVAIVLNVRLMFGQSWI